MPQSEGANGEAACAPHRHLAMCKEIYRLADPLTKDIATWYTCCNYTNCKGWVDAVEEFFAIIQEFWLALEEERAQFILPDPGLPAPSVEKLDAFIQALDQELNSDYEGIQGRKYEADAPTEMYRLDIPQWLALYQKVQSWKRKHHVALLEHQQEAEGNCD